MNNESYIFTAERLVFSGLSGINWSDYEWLQLTNKFTNALQYTPGVFTGYISYDGVGRMPATFKIDNGALYIKKNFEAGTNITSYIIIDFNVALNPLY